MWLVLLFALLFVIVLIVELWKTVFGKILFGILAVFLLVKLIIFIKKDHKYWFEITKSGIFKAIGIILLTLVLRTTLFIGSPLPAKIILYVVGLGLALWQIVNKHYSADKVYDERERLLEENRKLHEEEINLMKKNGTYEKWEGEQKQLREYYDMLLSKIQELKENDCSSYDVNFINKYVVGDSMSKPGIYGIQQIDNINLKMKIIKYASQHLSIEGICENEVGQIIGNIEEGMIYLPIKIINADNPKIEKFLNDNYKFDSLKVVDEKIVDHFLSETEISASIICEERDFRDRRVVIISDGNIVSNLECRNSKNKEGYIEKHGWLYWYNGSRGISVKSFDDYRNYK